MEFLGKVWIRKLVWMSVLTGFAHFWMDDDWCAMEVRVSVKRRMQGWGRLDSGRPPW